MRLVKILFPVQLKFIEHLVDVDYWKVFMKNLWHGNYEHSGLLVERQLEIPIRYKENLLAAPLKLNLLIEKLVIVEVKSVNLYNKIFESQTLTYLRLMNLKLGLVINFGEKRVIDGVHRVVNGL